MAVLDQAPSRRGPAFDRGVTRLSERTVEAMAELELAPEEALLGVLGIIRSRPEDVAKMGAMSDAALERHRQRSLRQYHAAKARRAAELAVA